MVVMVQAVWVLQVLAASGLPGLWASPLLRLHDFRGMRE